MPLHATVSKDGGTFDVAPLCLWPSFETHCGRQAADRNAPQDEVPKNVSRPGVNQTNPTGRVRLVSSGTQMRTGAVR